MAYNKPLPIVDERSRPFWAAAKRHELAVQQCDDCTQLTFPPAPLCAKCRGTRLHWTIMSGRGRLWSWTVFHIAYFTGFADELPYMAAIVELEEGPRMWTQVVAADERDLAIGQRVEAVFDDVTDDVTLVKFRIAGDT